jgi:hypothetical protein
LSALKLSKRERMDVYRRLSLLNRSFVSITQLLDELAESPIYKVPELREMQGRAHEVQLEINTKLLLPLESAEQRDHARFGKVHILNEKENDCQVSRPDVQASPLIPRIMLAIFAALAALLMFVSLFAKPGADWVYRSQDGIPAPCPPPNHGLFPRDCH